MNKLLLLLTVSTFSFSGFAQNKAKEKAATSSLNSKTSATTAAANNFVINGTLTGFADGSEVALLNGNTGAPESTVKLKEGRFVITGDATAPDFKILSVNNEQPYITLFLDNSSVTILAEKGKLEEAVVSGSPTHKTFTEFVALAKPYEAVFSGEASVSPEEAATGNKIFTSFIQNNLRSYVTPLAIYRRFQLIGDEAQMDSSFTHLNIGLQKSSIGSFVGQTVLENRKHPLGRPVVAFEEEDTDGKKVSLASFKGKYVLLDFWASWCRPCRQENPNVVEAYTKFKDKNFTILGISLDQAKPAWLDAIRMDNLTWQHVSDLKGWNSAVAAKYDVRSIPQNFLIDPNGILIAKNLRGEALQRKLTELLN